MRSTTAIETPRASVYLKQLCRHFGHRLETTFDDNDGRISFAFGACELHAGDDRLELTAIADDREARERVESVVGSHLERFAFREELRVTWPEDAPEGV
jgi:hypothetical protein